MIRLVFTLCALAFISSLCFAQQTSTIVSQSGLPPAETKTFTGKIESVTPGDYTKGIGLEIVVIDRKGQKLTFVVKENAAISAKDGKMLTLNEIKKDDKVTVEYITNLRGTHKANSIKLAD